MFYLTMLGLKLNHVSKIWFPVLYYPDKETMHLIMQIINPDSPWSVIRETRSYTPVVKAAVKLFSDC